MAHAEDGIAAVPEATPYQSNFDPKTKAVGKTRKKKEVKKTPYVEQCRYGKFMVFPYWKFGTTLQAGSWLNLNPYIEDHSKLSFTTLSLWKFTATLIPPGKIGATISGSS